MTNANKKKKEQLGIDCGTATNRLKKLILLDLLIQLNKNYCYRCGEIIEDISTLSVEHKIPWLDSEDPVTNFYSLDNIAFSHMVCNREAARNPWKGNKKHPSVQAYKDGCRCGECKEIQKLRMRKLRKKNCDMRSNGNS